MKKRIGKVITHSCIDVITNSSTELFCTVKGQKKIIDNVIKDMFSDMGCSAVEMWAEQAEDEESGKNMRGVYWIYYDFETHQPPCSYMMRQLKEKLNVIEEHDN